MAGLSQELRLELAKTAQQIATRGKGILAADESTGTVGKRFTANGVENTEANRMAYRQLLFQAKGLKDSISGVILFEETLYQMNSEKERLANMLTKEGIVLGIKVDKGVVVIPGTDDEKATEGLDGLGARCQAYYNENVRFAKWRAVLSIDETKGKPSNLSITETAHSLARYAAICQQNGLVPIVEPEILNDGSHGIEVCAQVTERVLAAVFKALHEHHVMLEGALLKPNMVTAGATCPTKASPEEIAMYTVRTLRRTVPPAIGGIMFLSGGQSEEEASCNLNAMNMRDDASPFFLSFSFGRALQHSCLKEWSGKQANEEKAKEVLLTRAKANSDAQLGKYTGGSGDGSSGVSLFEKHYAY